jgi:hypothetical protein
MGINLTNCKRGRFKIYAPPHDDINIKQIRGTRREYLVQYTII